MSVAPNLAEALRLALLANTDLIALGIESTNVYSTFAPIDVNAAGPWIVFTLVSEGETSSQDGNDGLEEARYQVTVGGTDKILIDKIRRVIARQFNGLTYDYVESSVHYKVDFFHSGGNESPWEPNAATYKVSVDLQIWIQT